MMTRIDLYSQAMDFRKLVHREEQPRGRGPGSGGYREGGGESSGARGSSDAEVNYHIERIVNAYYDNSNSGIIELPNCISTPKKNKQKNIEMISLMSYSFFHAVNDVVYLYFSVLRKNLF